MINKLTVVLDAAAPLRQNLRSLRQQREDTSTRLTPASKAKKSILPRISPLLTSAAACC